MFNVMVESVRWGNVEELLAVLVEQVDQLTRVTVMAYSDPKRRPRFGPPLRIPRPGEPTRPAPREGRSMSLSELVRAMKG